MDAELLSSLIRASRDVMEHAYCPYSHFRVGAAVLTDDNTVFTGCNVENVSYGLTNCAERTAIFTAVAQGHNKFKAVIISTDMPDDWSAPCGACRQVMLEFGPDIAVYMTKPDGTFALTTTGALLPGGFDPDKLEKHHAIHGKNGKPAPVKENCSNGVTSLVNGSAD